MSEPCFACPVPHDPGCLLKVRNQCHHAEREQKLRQRRPRAETPYTDRAVAHATRPNPFARPTPGRVRLAFLGAVISSHGGTETWHATLIPRLDPSRFAILGYGIAEQGFIDPSFAKRIHAHCPTPYGLQDSRQLCQAADIVVCWGVFDIASYVGPRDAAWHPITVAVSHGNGNSPWTETVFRDSDAVIDHYVAVSEDAKGPIPEARRSDARVILNAVDPDRLVPTRTRQEVRASIGVPDSAPLILYLGRLSSEKRPELAALAVERLSGVHLAIAGHGDSKADVQAITDRYADRVHWLGVRSDVADILNAADVLISPSWCEGFGLTVAESLWMGVPVVGTPVGVLADRPDLARLVPITAGVDAWADAIRSELANGPIVSRRVAHAQSFARSQLHPDRFAHEWSEYLMSLQPARDQRTATTDSRARSVRLSWPSQAELMANAEDCPHRSPMPEGQRTSCGCQWMCRIGQGPPRRRGGVTLQDCWDCPVAPRLSS